MKETFACLLALGLLLPAAMAKKQRKIDPRIKSIHTVFVEGKDDPWVRDAREALGQVKCLKLAPNDESADALMTVRWNSEEAGNYASSGPSLKGPLANPVPGGTDYVYRSIVDVKVREGDKLRKIWSESLILPGSQERKRSGVRRLVEEIGEDACSQP